MPEEVKVEDIMTRKVVVIDENATIKKAAEILRKKNIHGLVVVKGNEVTGMLTDKDIISKVVAENKSPLTEKVGSVMSPSLVTARPDDTIEDATRVMFANKLSRLPVIDDKGNLCGIVTTTDMMRVYPGLTDIMTERLDMEETEEIPDRLTFEGRCEECDNIVDDLVQIDGMWLCSECSEKHTVEGSKKLHL